MASIISNAGADNGHVSVAADQSHGHEIATPSPCQTIDLSNQIPDGFNQLPELPVELPKHEEFEHCLPPKPPIYRKFSVFLAGSIEMGRAVQWQPRMALELSPYPITVNNPRRPEWKNDEESMRQQVDWELSALEQADVICFFFDVATQSPVTLWELGKYTDSGKVVVCCGKNYCRYTNVKMSCETYGIPFVETFAELPAVTVKMLKEKGMELDTNGDLVGENAHVTKPKPRSKLKMELEIAALKKQVADLKEMLERPEMGHTA
ncbi:hypothetical protein BU23DRAFT_556167 [Bimuria novae-zelandiae CBS 107.79]|uniref:Uncharacterized protein n=1 Tax=Bimuria novae-zelandiae CBS 107.79 TaxID=1447943 RepID=A0A6A5V516_9PLEO|nr:hypothetical protein BU23DRAFT_556167 [Bimuria novae-zelandiae CBS 107.79]